MRKTNPLSRLQLRAEIIRKLTQLGAKELMQVHAGDVKSPIPCPPTVSCNCTQSEDCG